MAASPPILTPDLRAGVHVRILRYYPVPSVRRTPMDAPCNDRFFTELRGCTAELARIIDGDLERPVPTCPGWTFRQLATHVGRGHRWRRRSCQRGPRCRSRRVR